MRQRKGEDLSRRRFLMGVGLGSTLLGGVALTHTLSPEGPFSLKDDRRRLVAPQDLPVNRTAAQADVTRLVTANDWMLSIVNGTTVRALTRQDLAGLPQHTHTLPIACVEGWTVSAVWEGVRLGDLLDLALVPHGTSLRMHSLQRRGAFAATTMPAHYARDPRTLIALRLNGETLSVDHGYPARIIAPGRPGVMQTKWLNRIEAIV